MGDRGEGEEAMAGMTVGIGAGSSNTEIARGRRQGRSLLGGVGAGRAWEMAISSCARERKKLECLLVV